MALKLWQVHTFTKESTFFGLELPPYMRLWVAHLSAIFLPLPTPKQRLWYRSLPATLDSRFKSGMSRCCCSIHPTAQSGKNCLFVLFYGNSSAWFLLFPPAGSNAYHNRPTTCVGSPMATAVICNRFVLFMSVRHLLELLEHPVTSRVVYFPVI